MQGNFLTYIKVGELFCKTSIMMLHIVKLDIVSFIYRSTDIMVGRLRHTPKDFVSYTHIALLKAGITDEVNIMCVLNMGQDWTCATIRGCP